MGGIGARSATTNQRGNAIILDTFGNTQCYSAHLLGHDELCHKAFGFPAEAAIGMSFDQSRKRTPPGRSVRRAARLHEDGPATKRLKVLTGVQSHNGSSLKSHKFNKVYLKEKGTYYDTDDPSILMIPLLPSDQIMDWATDETTAVEYYVMVITFGDNSTGASVILQAALQVCSTEEIDDGRELLETFVLGLAGAVKTKDVKESFTRRELQSQTLAQWSSLVDNIKDGTVATIGVPGPFLAGDAEVHVAKGHMSLRTSLPDPWLVMLKAMINYSAFRGTKLMPACPPADDDGPPNTIQGVESERPEESFCPMRCNAGLWSCSRFHFGFIG